MSMMKFDDIGNTVNTQFKERAIQFASSIVLALQECDEELREEAIELFKQLESGELDAEDCNATQALLAEILFPNADDNGFPGLDLEEAEEIACREVPEAKEILDRMDQEESVFADRLRAAMSQKGITQEQLAEKLGVGQSAISMMLQRNCRPQKRTIVRMAEALELQPDELWPNLTTQ
jgi:lambda repressor-like predicted transcriptional regulator